MNDDKSRHEQTPSDVSACPETDHIRTSRGLEPIGEIAKRVAAAVFAKRIEGKKE